jgi:hypothetical protein
MSKSCRKKRRRNKKTKRTRKTKKGKEKEKAPHLHRVSRKYIYCYEERGLDN